MALKVKCPTCGRETEYSDKNPYRPFCSERCRLLDLGAWADESYTIKGKPLESDDDLFVSEETMELAKYHPNKKSSAR